MKIGCISNGFSKEAMGIREREWFPFLDAVFLSYEQGIQKPDQAIFKRCLSAWGAPPQECIYIGDGGSPAGHDGFSGDMGQGRGRTAGVPIGKEAGFPSS